ncbi:MAG: phosphotransferase [Gloeomargarita sp. SKYBB_i_bin120]|nr:phosphotransferase [Gloeomargarita sp. SKYG98]MCS7293586.1 phosphotransferase [Gloeomargarita sp. SKYB120]MDW8179152.1 phosphotransferase [Gloeomargarita sp. SKYBB_i_bin120]
MGVLYSDDFIAAFKQGVEQLAPLWGLSPQTQVRLLTVSENATFRADDLERDTPVIFRVYRPGYHTRDEIESEFIWIEALRAEGIVTTPEPLRTREGSYLASFVHAGTERYVAAFSFLQGKEPNPEDEQDLTKAFGVLGEISARLHAHAKSWHPPANFVRKTWDFSTTIGERPHWGPWQAALGLEPEGAAILRRCIGVLQRRVAAYGMTPDRFGLIHADLRVTNLLVDGDQIGVIDFDDCGFGWFIYDFAAAVSFLEHKPYIPLLAEAWLEGYRRVAPVAPEDVDMIPDFVMLRRIMLTAWIAGHSETPSAREAGLAAYTQGTIELAERYLSTR